MDLSLGNDIDEKEIKKGDLLFKANAKASKMYLVSKGELMAFSLSDDKRVIPLYVAKAGDIIGEDCLFEKEYNYSVTALGDSTVVPVSFKDVTSFLKSSPGWISKIIEIISSRIISTQEMIREHKIVDPLLNDGSELQAEDENFIKKLI